MSCWRWRREPGAAGPAAGLAVALAAALAAAGASAPPAGAHAALLSTSPPPGARVDRSPAAIELRFTEPLNGRLSRATLRTTAGRPVAGVRSGVGGARIVLRPARPLARGAYVVDWHAVSTEDGHPLDGSFAIGVAAAAGGGARSTVAGPLDDGGWARIAARMGLYAALLLFAGMLLLAALLGRRGRSWLAPPGLDEAAVARARELACLRGAAALATVAAIAWALADAAGAAQGLDPSRMSSYLLSSPTGVTRTAAVALVALAALLTARAPRAAALSVTLALGAIAASGHARATASPVLAVGVDWLHLLAAAVWLGGIGAIALVHGPLVRAASTAGRRALAGSVLAVFGRAALPGFALVVATGAASAVLELGRLSALWTTGYGRVLAVKLGFVAAIAALSWLHALRLRPRLLAAAPGALPGAERRHWRALAAEPVLGIGVVAAVAVLVAFPLPPRQHEAVEAARAAAPACRGCPLPTPGPDQLGVAEQAGSHLVAAWVSRSAGGLAGELRVLDVRGRPAPVALALDGARLRPCGRGCWRFERPRGGATLDASLTERGRRYTARLPVRWDPRASRRAARLLRAAERAMRALRSVRQYERIASVPGLFAQTTYRLEAPDRVAYRGGGAAVVEIGARAWLRPPGGVWMRRRGDPLGSRTAGWFRWTPYARSVRLLAIRGAGRRRVAEVALMDPGTPVWYRLTIDLATRRVLSGRMIAPGHYMDERYYAFNRPNAIRPPRVGRATP